MTRSVRRLFEARWVRAALKIAIAAAILAVIIRAVDFTQLGRTLSRVSIGYILIAVAVLGIDRLLMGYKWALLVRTTGTKLGLFAATRIYLICGAIGLVLPATVGLDAARIYWISREGMKGGMATASVVVERILGVLALGVTALVSSGIFLAVIRDAAPQLLVVAAVLASVVATVSLVSVLNMQLLLRRLPLSALPDRLKRVVTSIGEALGAYRKHKSTLVYVFFLSLVEQTPHIVVAYLVALSLGLGIGLIECLAVFPLVMLLDRIPISFDGLVIREGALIVLFGMAGVAAAETLALAVMIRVAQYVYMALGLALYLQAPTKSRLEAGM